MSTGSKGLADLRTQSTAYSSRSNVQCKSGVIIQSINLTWIGKKTGSTYWPRHMNIDIFTRLTRSMCLVRRSIAPKD